VPFAAIESPSLALAFAAGFVSFVSPCVLPLVPGYLAAVSGVAPADDSARRVDPRLLTRCLVFVGTFSAIFILLGLSATAAGSLLRDNKQTLDKIAGVAIIVMGVFFIASVFVVRLNAEWHPQKLIERAGRGGPVVAGAAFAIAWTPCVGPALGAILSLAAQDGTVGRGALLLTVYSLGLAVPFLFSAIAFSAAQRSFGFFKRHYAAIQVTAGLVLVVMGVLVLDGELNRLNSEAQQFLDSLGLNFFQDV
jgi:cytochrome c-type biogenesis protein